MPVLYFVLRLLWHHCPVSCKTLMNGRFIRFLNLFLGKLTESSIEGILITSFEKYQINWRLFALVLFQSIVNSIFSGIVLDGGGFYEELSLGEMKGIISSAYTSWSEQDFKRYMDMFSLDPKQKINSLSKGMRMKYALALALSHNAELLIMDEPTSGLDPLVRGQLLKILTEYMENGGKGVFFSTHITSDLDKIADMLIMIDNGRIVFREEKDTLLDTYRIVKGDSGALTTDARKLFLSISETDFGFTGITKQISEVRSYIPNIMVERPTIEDIMLGNIGGEK